MKINDKTCIHCRKKLVDLAYSKRCQYCKTYGTPKYEIAYYCKEGLKYDIIRTIWIHFTELDCRASLLFNEKQILQNITIYANNNDESPKYITLNSFPINDITNRKILAQKIKTYLNFL